jgi:hypothetical protein
VYLLVFHAYIKEMHCSRNKIHSKNLFRQRYAEGFNSGVKGLKLQLLHDREYDVLPLGRTISGACKDIIAQIVTMRIVTNTLIQSAKN